MADGAETADRRRILGFAWAGVLGAIAVVIAVVVVSNDGRSDRAPYRARTKVLPNGGIITIDP